MRGAVVGWAQGPQKCGKRWEWDGKASNAVGTLDGEFSSLIIGMQMRDGPLCYSSLQTQQLDSRQVPVELCRATMAHVD